MGAMCSSISAFLWPVMEKHSLSAPKHLFEPMYIAHIHGAAFALSVKKL